MSSARIRQNADKVQIIKDGKLVMEMPWDAALEFTRAMRGVARLAETYAKANAVIIDHAILLRAGVPIGLTDGEKFHDEVAKEAAHNRDLRRYMPGGVKSKAIVGTPSVIRHKPGV